MCIGALAPVLRTIAGKDFFRNLLEETRRSYRFDVIGYVVMPEHVHLLEQFHS